MVGLIRCRVEEHTDIIRELLRDAIGTQEAVSLLRVVSGIETQTAHMTRLERTVNLRLNIKGREFVFFGGSIHATPWDSWDVFTDGDDLDHSPHFDWVENSACLRTSQMVALVKEIASR